MSFSYVYIIIKFHYVWKIVLSVTDLRDFSTYIQKFGNLSETNPNSELNNQNKYKTFTDTTNTTQPSGQNYFSSNSLQNFNSNSNNSINHYDPYLNIQPRQRQTWDRTASNNIYNYETEIFSTPRIDPNTSSPRATVRTSAVQARIRAAPPVTFTIGLSTGIYFEWNFFS